MRSFIPAANEPDFGELGKGPLRWQQQPTASARLLAEGLPDSGPGEAPPSLADFSTQRVLQDSWQDLRRALRQRLRGRNRLPPDSWALGSSHPLSWAALPEENLSIFRPGTSDQPTAWSEFAEAWLAQPFGPLSSKKQQARQASEDRPLIALGWAYALPRVANSLEPQVWVALFRYLVGLVDQFGRAPPAATESLTPDSQPAENQDANGGSTSAGPWGDPWREQLYCVELPLVLVYSLPEFFGPRFREALQGRIIWGLFRWVSEQGFLATDQLESTRRLLACWTRCLLLVTSSAQPVGQQSKPDLPTGELVPTRFARFVRRTLDLSDPAGGQLLTEDWKDPSWPRELLTAALNLCALESGELFTETISTSLSLWPLGRRAPRHFRGIGSPPALREDAGWADPAVHCETTRRAVLRGGWSAAEPVLAVDYRRGSELMIELAAGSAKWLCGLWPVVVREAGQLVLPEGSWEPLLYKTDPDVAYLELQQQLAGGLTLQRQILLARPDRLVLLADALLFSPERDFDVQETEPVELEVNLPVSDSVTVLPAPETREIWLQSGSAQSRAIPLSLPEWHSQWHNGKSTAEAGRLQLIQKLRKSDLGKEPQGSFPGARRGVFGCWALDLEPSRQASWQTWRQLTVAEQRQVVPPTVAVGHLLRLGPHQWMVYRSLAPQAPRTVLGVHLRTEFLAARFRNTGLTDTILEIE